MYKGNIEVKKMMDIELLYSIKRLDKDFMFLMKV